MRAFLRGHDGNDHQIQSKLTTVGCEGCDVLIKVRADCSDCRNVHKIIVTTL